jgi:hypothetical protein
MTRFLFRCCGIGLLLSNGFGIAVASNGAADSAQIIDLEVKNPGFEASAVEPTGWSMRRHVGVSAYEKSVDDEVFSEGKHSFRIERLQEQVYGLIKQFVPLQGHDGDTLVYSAQLRAADVGRSGWMLSVNFLSRGGAILKQVRSKPVTGTRDWALAEVRHKIPAGTAKIGLAVMLLADGTGWVDDIRLRVEPAAPKTAE